MERPSQRRVLPCPLPSSVYCNRIESPYTCRLLLSAEGQAWHGTVASTASAQTRLKRASLQHWDTPESRRSLPRIAGQPTRRRHWPWSWPRAGLSRGREKSRRWPRMARRPSMRLETVGLVEAESSLQQPRVLLGWIHSFLPGGQASLLWYNWVGAGVYCLEVDGSQWVESVASWVPVKVKPAKGKPNGYRLCTSLRTIHKSVHDSRLCWLALCCKYFFLPLFLDLRSVLRKQYLFPW